MNEHLKKLLIGSTIIGGFLLAIFLFVQLMVLAPEYLPVVENATQSFVWFMALCVFLGASYVIGTAVVEGKDDDDEAAFWHDIGPPSSDPRPDENFVDLQTEHSAEKEDER